MSLPNRGKRREIPPICRVLRGELEVFLMQQGDAWEVDAGPDFMVSVSHLPLTTRDVIDSLTTYRPDIDYVYVLSSAVDIEKAISQLDWKTIPQVDRTGLADYIVRIGRGNDFLWLFPSDEDLSNMTYVTLLPSQLFVSEEVQNSSSAPRSGLTAIEIENFKGIGPRQRIELKPLTLLFGANSAGKSTLLHALHYAREVFERHNLDADQTIAGGPFVDLGGFCNFVHRGMRPTHSATVEPTSGDDSGYGGAGDGSGAGVGTAYGEGFVDGSGYGDGFGTSPPHREVRIAISLAISDASLPEYLQPDDYNPYDQLESLYAGIEETRVEIALGWSDRLAAPHVTEYSVGFNGTLLATITSQPGRRMPILETLDLNHPILTRRKDMERFVKWDSWTPDEVDDGNYSALRYLLNKVRRNRWVPVWEDDTFKIFESLARQEDALPAWGKRLPLSDWRDDGVADQPLDPADREELETDNREINTVLSRLIVGPGELVRNELRKFRYLGPLRETPPRDFSPPRFPDPSRWANGMGAWDVLHTGPDGFVDVVSQWLSDPERLNAGYEIIRTVVKELDTGDPLVLKLVTGRAFDEAEDARLDLDRLPSHRRLFIQPLGRELRLRPHDIGVGISQVVPVVVTALEGKDRLVTVEQPELHLHPRLQAELGDLFIESALGDRRHRVLLELHSEHLILRLLRRIRESGEGKAHRGLAIDERDIAIYYAKSVEGETRFLKIDVDKRGDFIQPWPDDFFEVDFYERFGDAR